MDNTVASNTEHAPNHQLNTENAFAVDCQRMDLVEDLTYLHLIAFSLDKVTSLRRDKS